MDGMWVVVRRRMELGHLVFRIRNVETLQNTFNKIKYVENEEKKVFAEYFLSLVYIHFVLTSFVRPGISSVTFFLFYRSMVGSERFLGKKVELSRNRRGCLGSLSLSLVRRVWMQCVMNTEQLA